MFIDLKCVCIDNIERCEEALEQYDDGWINIIMYFEE